jgi:hypothetical protein
MREQNMSGAERHSPETPHPATSPERGSVRAATGWRQVSQRLQGFGAIERDGVQIGAAEYALQFRVVPVPGAGRQHRYNVVYGRSVEGTIAMVESPPLPVGDEVSIALANGMRYRLWVNSPAPEGIGSQQVIGVAQPG